MELKSITVAGSLAGHTRRVSAVSLSPDGRQALSASLDGSVRVWDLTGGSCRLVLQHASDVNAVAFTPDGRRALSASGNPVSPEGRAQMWDLASRSKAERTPARDRSAITLAINVADAPALGLDRVVANIRSAFTAEIVALGFASVWLVGEIASLTHRLDQTE
jgi:WD40 repeat protein